MELFYSNNINDDTIILDDIESRHCVKVLRKSIGDKINVVDGNGNLYKGIVESDNLRDCKIKIFETIKNYDKRDNYIHIAISPIKNSNRIEWFIEKVVEIGVDEISFIDCHRTLRHSVKMERILKTSISAMKQTLKATLPKINDICSFEDFLDTSNHSNQFICHLEDNNRKEIFNFKNQLSENRDSCILIGPEGDFSMDEIARAKKYNFNAISLGDSRLRTETAGIVACHLLNIINRYD